MLKAEAKPDPVICGRAGVNNRRLKIAVYIINGTGNGVIHILKLILTTFWLVFVAELGDKTQITTMLLVAEKKSLWPIFVGAALALICSSVVGVFAGKILLRYVPPDLIRNMSAVAFIAIGVLLLFGKI